MNSKNNTKEQLLSELAEMRQRIAELEATDTERKQADEALRESEKRFRSIAETASDAIIIFDSHENIFFWNQAAKIIFGYSAGETRGRLLASIMPQRFSEVFRGEMDRMISARESGLIGRAVEMTGIRKNGSEFPLELTLATWRTKEEAFFTIIARDITERKRMQEALREYSEQLEGMVEERTRELREAQERLLRQEKLAVLGQLAGGVGHELRNPLGAISNAVYFLNMVLEESDPEVKETLEILEKEVKTSEQIITGLLDFGRARPPTWRKADVNEIIQEALSRVTVPESVEVVSQLDETLPIILADPGQLGQVFGNIIVNAIQAMPEGGRLIIRSEVPDPEWVAVSFADTGVGISEESLDKIFEPLFTTKAKGIGLGLALVKILVEGHSGTIEVESQVGKGSTFTVRLPLSVSK
jgi:two-component system sensor kinase FixL